MWIIGTVYEKCVQGYDEAVVLAGEVNLMLREISKNTLWMTVN